MMEPEESAIGTGPTSDVHRAPNDNGNGTREKCKVQRQIFQFKINVTSCSSSPTIWRRIQVPTEFDFWEFHCAIQNAFGWRDISKHRFILLDKINRQIIFSAGKPNKIGSEWTLDEVLSAYIPQDSKPSILVDDLVKMTLPWKIPMNKYYSPNIIYDTLYIYGDGKLKENWVHDVILEGVYPLVEGISYPLCIAGQRACPPEDFCGGPKGFEILLKNLKKRPEDRSMQERLEIELLFNGVDYPTPNYNPDVFDASKVRFMCPAGRLARMFTGSWNGDHFNPAVQNSEEGEKKKDVSAIRYMQLFLGHLKMGL